MRFWDSSAIVPLIVNEPRSGVLRYLIRQDEQMIVWWGTLLECFSALARREKDGLLRAPDVVRAREQIEGLVEGWTEIISGEDLRQSAERAIFLHPLRAADSLQLAAALVWVRHQPHHHEFVCLDHSLRDAARAEGFHVIPESL
ncbi:MAG: type II toxin-antitoxin system VapC family toxin [Elusimicrobia bacterium]|nr:type II toxin-antitoxin system VapC family toxin [Elusimicrobiota bacterium]